MQTMQTMEPLVILGFDTRTYYLRAEEQEQLRQTCVPTL